MTSSPIITLEHVGVKYRKRYSIKSASGHSYWALKDVNLNISRGETIGISGRNGAGKSTLLKTIANIINPNKGRVINKLSARTGILSLRTGFLPQLSGEQNIILNGLYLGVSRKFINSVKGDIMELAGLGDFIKEPVRSYSTGMSARLGFAIAYYCAPDVLLIDEILGVGDAEFKKTSSTMIKKMIKSNKTVVLVSHDQNVLEELSDRILYLEDGVIHK